MIPSKEWTTKERLALISVMAQKLKNGLSVLHARDCAENIELIACMKSQFLEKNREQVLEFLRPEEEKE